MPESTASDTQFTVTMKRWVQVFHLFSRAGDWYCQYVTVNA